MAASPPFDMIPVCRPLLPTQEDIAPYLRRVDTNRWYTNFGPLSVELSERFADRLGIGDDRVVLATNATAALTATLMGLAGGGEMPAPLALMPAWTFVATPHAAAVAGLTPYFADVDRDTWQLTPALARAALGQAPGRVAAVVPVSPFGAPVDLAAWEAFSDDTGIPVVVDAAAGFDTAAASRVTSVVSLHATKSLPAGEGAVVVCPDADAADVMKRRLNFGFRGSRDAALLALNAKISEYHAAVGLAALDQWPARRQRFADAIGRYRRQLEGNAVRLQPGIGSDWVTATVVAAWPDAAAAGAALAAQGIETRAWWGAGCHLQPAFAHCPRTEMPVTAILAQTTLGLPLSIDIGDAEIARVCAAVAGLL